MAKLSSRIEKILEEVTQMRDYLQAEGNDVYLLANDAARLLSCVLRDLDSAMLDEELFSERDGNTSRIYEASNLVQWHGERMALIRIALPAKEELNG